MIRLLWSSLFLLPDLSSGDIYEAVSQLEGLLDTDKMIINTVSTYLQRIEERLNYLKRKLTEYEKDHKLFAKTANESSINPITAYAMIKRFAVDWKQFETNMSFESITKESLFNMSIIEKEEIYPVEKDLNETKAAIIRLQQTYDLDVRTLAKGIVNEFQSSIRLSAKDCYDIGIYAFTKSNFIQAKPWFHEALELLHNDNSAVEEWIILEHLAYLYYLEGNIPKAHKLTVEWLKLYPDHPRGSKNKQYYEEIMNSFQEQCEDEECQYRLAGNISVDQLTDLTCRKSISVPIELTSKLKCHYIHQNIPFLRLAPFKQEEVYLNPTILLFKEVITESEIEELKNIAKLKLTSAKVETGAVGGTVDTTARLSKLKFLTKHDTSLVDVLYQRVEDMTLLTTETAEDIQVLNYGIGGHYKAHPDYFAEKDMHRIQMVKERGNRIATVLFYLSDVTDGGATVFPHLHLGIVPEKGSAVFWMNLHPDGQPDPNTWHASCPVVVGSKWVATVWFHEKGQEFRRPCGLIQTENSLL